MQKTLDRRLMSLPWLFVGGVALTLAMALWIFYVLMRPPLGDLSAMASFLMITAVVSVLSILPAWFKFRLPDKKEEESVAPV